MANQTLIETWTTWELLFSEHRLRWGLLFWSFVGSPTQQTAFEWNDQWQSKSSWCQFNRKYLNGFVAQLDGSQPLDERIATENIVAKIMQFRKKLHRNRLLDQSLSATAWRLCCVFLIRKLFLSLSRTKCQCVFGWSAVRRLVVVCIMCMHIKCWAFLIPVIS